MDNNGKALVEMGDKLFSKKRSLDGLRQEIAIHFYPERADFTAKIDWGEDFASHLFESFPVYARRTLGDSFASMLRPRGTKWFGVSVLEESIARNTTNAKFLSYMSDITWKHLYAPWAKFAKSQKNVDHDYACFGDGITGIDINRDRTGLIFSSYHPKDCAWTENDEGDIDNNHRNFMMSAFNIKRKWPNAKLHDNIEKCLEKDPHKEFKIRHIMIPVDLYEYYRKKTNGDKLGRSIKFASLYVDVEHQQIIAEDGTPQFRYAISRWNTLSGSPYGFSPAAIVGLPDARLIQDQARVILEAGEKAVDPPIVATEKAVRSDVNIMAGGVTWIDREYDERLGRAVQPLPLGGDVSVGLAMKQDTRTILSEAFFLNKIQMPQSGGRTAFETAQLVEQYIRDSIPLFEPSEIERNGKVLDIAVSIIAGEGGYGPSDIIPQDLRGRDISFTYDNPLQMALEKRAMNNYREMLAAVGESMQLDPGMRHEIDVRAGFREAIQKSEAVRWMRTDEEAMQFRNQEAQAAQQQQQMEAASAQAQIMDQTAQAVNSSAEAGQNIEQLLGLQG
jgi:hypothetical protein